MSTDAARLRTTHRAAFYLERNPEARILNMRELRAIHAAHQVDYTFTAGAWRAVCPCGVELLPSPNVTDLADLAAQHVAAVIEFATARKCAEARANVERDRIDAEVEHALLEGYTPRPRLYLAPAL